MSTIRVECPGCSKTIKAPEKYAGTIAKCPGCGNKLRIPELTTTAPPAPTTPAPPMQSIGRGDSSKEQDLLLLHPSTFRTRPIKYFIVLFWIAITSLIAAFGKNTSTQESMPVFWLLPAIGVLVLALWHFGSMTTTLRITNKRSILRNGILSKRTREVRHSDVRLLQVDQSFAQRLFGVGTLAIASAGHGEVEISISGITNPQHVKETIDGYR